MPKKIQTEDLPKRTYELCEALADIAYLAGRESYYGGDSREDVANFIKWAQEFEAKHKDNDWEGGDYIETIETFAAKKMEGTQIKVNLCPTKSKSKSRRKA